MSRSHVADRLRPVSSVPVADVLPAMRARRRLFFPDFFLCFSAHAGQWRRNPAVRTRDGSRDPPFPVGASLPVRGAGCVSLLASSFLLLLFTPAFHLLSMARTAASLPIGCQCAEFPFHSMTCDAC